MKLEIISERFVDTIYGITLDEGITPCLSSLSEEELATFKIPEVEPALWFKTLVLTRVTVDCVRRQMTWATEKSHDCSEDFKLASGIKRISHSDEKDGTKSNVLANVKLRPGKGKNKFDLKRLSESVFLHASNADQSTDIEELFMSTELVVTRYSSDKVINRVGYYEEMFRILHCYILPAITFDKEDVPQLEAAMEFQNSLIEVTLH